jgi:hypothetical protein
MTLQKNSFSVSITQFRVLDVSSRELIFFNLLVQEIRVAALHTTQRHRDRPMFEKLRQLTRKSADLEAGQNV